MTAKDFAKLIARRLGIELRRFRPSSSQAAQLRAMLLSNSVNLIFDVGANVGQFGRELRWHVGYRGRIVSFEPLQAAHRALVNAAAGDELWEVADCVAIGAEQGSVTLNVAGNSVSSSILPMLASHVQAAPESRYSGVQLVPMLPLDAVAPVYLKSHSVVFLKIDTQGYESQVLQGAHETLARAVGVQLEMSLISLYAGQKLMPEITQWMNNMGFELWGISCAFAEPVTGRTLQVDATFFKTRSSTDRPYVPRD